MAAVYPGAFKPFTTHVDYTETILAQHMNDAQNEIMAIEQTLGTYPFIDNTGPKPVTYPTVSARMDALNKGSEQEAFMTGLTSAAPNTLIQNGWRYVGFNPTAYDDHGMKSTTTSAGCLRSGWFAMNVTIYIGGDIPPLTSRPWGIYAAIDLSGHTAAITELGKSANDNTTSYLNVSYVGPWNKGQNAQVKIWHSCNNNLALTGTTSTFSIVRIRDI